jgi:hypothetical protein
MKKLLIIAAILLFASTAMAADISAVWTHDGVNTTGYTLYFWKTLNPAEVYNKSVLGNTVRSMALNEDYFAPGVEYSFQMTAFNEYKESGRSATAVWTRAGQPFSAAADKLPSVIYIAPPQNVNGVFIQMP